MNVTLTKRFGFEAAHNLPNLPEGHKCRRLHGHSFRFTVSVYGPVDEHTGLFLDYADIKAVVDPIVSELDHRYLNEIEGLENPSSEVIARFLWRRIAPVLPSLTEIVVNESCTSACSYRGD